MIFTGAAWLPISERKRREERGKKDEGDGRREKEKKDALETLGAGVPDKTQLEPPGNPGSKTHKPRPEAILSSKGPC